MRGLLSKAHRASLFLHSAATTRVHSPTESILEASLQRILSAHGASSSRGSEWISHCSAHILIWLHSIHATATSSSETTPVVLVAIGHAWLCETVLWAISVQTTVAAASATTTVVPETATAAVTSSAAEASATIASKATAASTALSRECFAHAVATTVQALIVLETGTACRIIIALIRVLFKVVTLTTKSTACSISSRWSLLITEAGILATTLSIIVSTAKRLRRILKVVLTLVIVHEVAIYVRLLLVVVIIPETIIVATCSERVCIHVVTGCTKTFLRTLSLATASLDSASSFHCWLLLREITHTNKILIISINFKFKYN